MFTNRIADYTLLLYPAILLFFTFYKSVLYKSQEFSPDMWDRNQAKMMQAVACIGVVLHHITQRISSYGSINRGPITILSSMGILFTSIFFFFTGFGLIISVQNNTEYINTFLRHRLSTVLIPFFSANTVCVLVRIFYNHIPTMPKDIVRAILGFTLLNGNGWYIVEVFFLYIFFYIFFRFVKNKNIAILLLCISSLLIIYYSYGLGHDYSDIGDRPFYGEWWFNSTIVFSMGVVFARFREKITNFIKKYYGFVLTSTTILFVITFIIEEHVLKTRGYYIESASIDRISNAFVTLIAQSTLCLIFTFLMLLINAKIKIGNKILSAISTIATELFLIHGVFLNSIFDFSNINYFFTYAIVFACSIPAAILLHFIDSKVIALIQYRKPVKHSYTKEEYEERKIQEGNRKKRRKLFTCVTGLLILAGALVSFIYVSLLRPVIDCKSEINSLTNASFGDIVLFGRYDTTYVTPGKERVSWIVLEKNDDTIKLLCEEGLLGSVYNKTHEATDWESSYIRDYLNNELYNNMFSDKEKQLFDSSSDLVSLLTVDEAAKYFNSDIERQLHITDVALKSGTNINTLSKDNHWDTVGYRSSWWWLRGEKKDITAPIVTVDGDILINKKYVNKPNGAIRPVITLYMSPKSH